MQRKLPEIKKENRILIVCEGYEEYDYLQKLKTCNVWDKSISVELKNAKSIDNISAVYSYNYSSGNYRLILVFCDTEKYPYESFNVLKEKINALHGHQNAADQVVFFANPCTLQVVLSHFTNVRLTTNSKCDNATIVEKLTGIKEYKATESQRKIMMKKITSVNYEIMKQNLSKLSCTYTDVPSSNALLLFNILDSGDQTLIEQINQEIEND
ncbi:MAG: hypothetical protein NC485_14940 [Ruminococcus flavefaciens]|nr:hypothetical protein [Ruminococcus flavefaciens]